MKKFVQRLLTGCLLLAFMAALPTACIPDGEDEQIERVAVGDRVPPFRIVLNDGSTYDSSTAGASIIVFFHTDCTDCQRELPRLDALYKAGEFTGKRVVCISRGEDEAGVSVFWEKHDLALPYSAQHDRSIFNLFATAVIPRIYETDDQSIVIRITKQE